MVLLYKDGEWEIGCFSPDGIWHMLRRFESTVEAEQFLRYLNGGNQ